MSFPKLNKEGEAEEEEEEEEEEEIEEQPAEVYKNELQESIYSLIFMHV